MSDSGSSSSGNAALENAMERLMQKGFDQMQADDGKNDGKTTKLFGVVDVPTSAATIVQMVWNEGAHEFTGWLRPHSAEFYTEIGTKLGIKDAVMLRRGVAAATLATTAVLVMAPNINPLFDSWRKQHEAKQDVARKIAPVLDEIRGGHSVGQLMAVKSSENEMIYAHRKRLSMHADTENVNNLLKLMNAAPNLVAELPHVGSQWTGGAAPAEGSGNLVQRLGGMATRLGAAPLVTLMTSANERHLKKRFSSEHSALEMVLKLEEQVQHSPKADSFQTPGGDSLPLEEYIGAVMIQHQKDMADLSSDYTELRPALKEDVAAVAKPLAEAVRDGDISALGLIGLIGGGKVVKDKGRSISAPEQVEALIKRDKPKAHTFTTVDAKEFYANSSFTRDELRDALASLEGDEKEVFAAMFPDSILEEAGMAKEEIGGMRLHMAQRYEHVLAQVVSGVAAKSDDELKKDGLATQEIKQLREAADKLKDKGEGAIHELKSEGNSTAGIEQPIVNLAVRQQVTGNKQYFGTLLSRGQDALKELAEKAAEPADKPEQAEKPEKNGHAAQLEEARAQAS